MHVDDPDQLGGSNLDVHHTKVSVRLDSDDAPTFLEKVREDCKKYFGDNWNDKYRHWHIEEGTTGGTIEDKYIHAIVYVEARPGTERKKLSQWAKRFVKSQLQSATAANK